MDFGNIHIGWGISARLTGRGEKWPCPNGPAEIADVPYVCQKPNVVNTLETARAMCRSKSYTNHAR